MTKNKMYFNILVDNIIEAEVFKVYNNMNIRKSLTGKHIIFNNKNMKIKLPYYKYLVYDNITLAAKMYSNILMIIDANRNSKESEILNHIDHKTISGKVGFLYAIDMIYGKSCEDQIYDIIKCQDKCEQTYSKIYNDLLDSLFETYVNLYKNKKLTNCKIDIRNEVK